LYARYCIFLISSSLATENDNKTMLVEGKIPLHFNVFCSTATPHLGVSGYTWLPLPRPAELGIAKIMGKTGEDLFRLNNIVYEMATCSIFLEPLSLFRKRIAYANAYHTDFPVPSETAAFLNRKSHSLHRFEENKLRNQNIVAVVSTENTHKSPEEKN